jgi:hypothetical protein
MSNEDNDYRSTNKNFSKTCQNFETNGATFTADCQDETGDVLGNSVNLGMSFSLLSFPLPNK